MNNLEPLYRYHAWRIRTLAQHFASIPNANLHQPIPGSFATLQKLLAHCVGAEEVWYGRLHGTSAAQLPPHNYETFKEAFDAWRHIGEKWLLLLDKLEDQDLRSSFTYTNTQGKTYTDNRGQIFYHVIDHATYHVGQLIVALRHLGLPAVSTNYIFYLRQVTA